MGPVDALKNALYSSADSDIRSNEMLNLRCILSGMAILTVIIIVGCGGSGSSGPEGQSEVDEHWYGSVDASAIWVDVDEHCVRRVEATKEKADSVCVSLGFTQAAGYDPLECWVGEEQGQYLECVACTNQD